MYARHGYGLCAMVSLSAFGGGCTTVGSYMLDQTAHRPWPIPERPWVLSMRWHDRDDGSFRIASTGHKTDMSFCSVSRRRCLANRADSTNVINSREAPPEIIIPFSGHSFLWSEAVSLRMIIERLGRKQRPFRRT